MYLPMIRAGMAVKAVKAVKAVRAVRAVMAVMAVVQVVQVVAGSLCFSYLVPVAVSPGGMKGGMWVGWGMSHNNEPGLPYLKQPFSLSASSSAIQQVTRSAASHNPK